MFRCVDALTGADEDCDNDGLWEAPLEDWHEPTCFACMRPACLVEVVGHEDDARPLSPEDRQAVSPRDSGIETVERRVKTVYGGAAIVVVLVALALGARLRTPHT